MSSPESTPSSAPPFGRLTTAMITPFRPDGSLDLDAAQKVARHLVDGGNDALVLNGTTGEAPTTSDEEKVRIIQAVREAVGDGIKLVAGVGTNDTAHTIACARQAEAAGADGLLVVTPYYNKPPPRGIVEHFKAIAAASDRPIIVYNIPQRVVVNIEPETLIELAEIPSVQAVKQATEDLDQARRIVAETDLALYAGSDHLLQPFLELGGAGGILVYAHLVAARVKEQVRLYRDGDVDGARAIDQELKPVIDALAVTINPIPVKAALSMFGHDVGGLRLPLVEASEEERAEIRSGLERAGLTVQAGV